MMEGITRIDIAAPAPGEPKLRIECFGKYCAVYAGNLMIGRGVKSVEFQQEAEKRRLLKSSVTLNSLHFL